MKITLTPDQEEVVQEAIRAGRVRSVDELIEAAIEFLPHPEGKVTTSREDAVRRMLEFGELHRLGIGESVTRKFLHEEHRF